MAETKSNVPQSTINNCGSVLSKISGLYCDRILSDVTLRVGAREYPAHRLILCASSDVFQVMLLKPEWSESCESVVVLHEAEECVAQFGPFLRYLYTGTVTLTHATVLPILALADKYNVEDLRVVCGVYMKQHVVSAAEHNLLLSWLQYCMASQHTAVATACLNHFKWNFEQVARTSDFLNCDVGLLTSVLAQHDLVVHDEMTLYTFVVNWLKHQESRLQVTAPEHLQHHRGPHDAATPPHSTTTTALTGADLYPGSLLTASAHTKQLALLQRPPKLNLQIPNDSTQQPECVNMESSDVSHSVVKSSCFCSCSATAMDCSSSPPAFDCSSSTSASHSSHCCCTSSCGAHHLERKLKCQCRNTCSNGHNIACCAKMNNRQMQFCQYSHCLRHNGSSTIPLLAALHNTSCNTCYSASQHHHHSTNASHHHHFIPQPLSSSDSGCPNIHTHYYRCRQDDLQNKPNHSTSSKTDASSSECCPDTVQQPSGQHTTGHSCGGDSRNKFREPPPPTPPPLKLGTGKLYLRCSGWPEDGGAAAAAAAATATGAEDIAHQMECLTYEVMSFVRFPMMTPRQLADLLLVPLTIHYKEFFVTRMAIGMAFHSGQWSRVREVVESGDDASRLLFTPRLYTAEQWSAGLTVDNLPDLPNYHTRTLVFSTPASASELENEAQLEWIVELYPKGVWFRKYMLIVWQGTVEVPEAILRSVRLSVTYNSASNNTAGDKTCTSATTASPRVRLAVLVFAYRDGVEFVSHVVTRRHIFSPDDCLLNMDDILPFNSLNDNKESEQYLLQPCNSLKIHVVISPLSPPAYCPPTTS